MKSTKVILSSLILLASAQSVFAASSGTINFSGEVKDSTCVITTGDENKSVLLPTVPLTALSTVGNTAGTTAFTLTFEGCDAGNVKAAFVPTDNAANLNGENVKNIGSAAGIDVALYQADGTTKIALNDPAAASTAVEATDPATPVAINLVAKYISTDAATAGSVNGNLKYEIHYE